MSDTFTLVLGTVLVLGAIAVSLFLYVTSRRSQSTQLTEQERAERDARTQLEAAQGTKIRTTGRGAGL
ncbi:hypothetical protein [Cryobacterium sp. PAMC25264]|uniref:hypothetical protein n=1 Tax=Cryobacterium sp. PAMC25264 TaxID=2861288 RepID=UPI001C634AD9|nr:hypothetical protein [Cryobacterium sp. PAMC25264]QYF72280.1 hypothetical protein KY500_10475 [Cryobacterium sp. PAMC25264]